jgi:preprotein translocase subunit Sss1
MNTRVLAGLGFIGYVGYFIAIIIAATTLAPSSRPPS